MLFTEKQIEKLTGIVDVKITTLLAQILGKDQLTDYDRSLLVQYNIDIDKLVSIFPPYWQAYMFGRLTGILTPQQASSLTSVDYSTYLRKKQYVPPTQLEKEEYDISVKRTYSHIKGLGDKIKTYLIGDIHQQELEQLMIRKKHREEVVSTSISEGILNRKSIQQITSDIGNELKQWDRDWTRIVETECQNIYNMGRAQIYSQKEDGMNTLVYKDVFPLACRHCISLYLTGGIGSKPIIFKLSKLIENGSNVGKKVRDWKATINIVHPFCRCELRYIPKGYVWNEETHSFQPPKTYERKVERKGKVKIIVGDKHFEV